MKPINVAFIVILVMLVSFAVFFDFQKLKEKISQTPEGEVEQGNNATTNTTQWTDDSFPLKLYSKGEKVKKLQKNLNFIYKKGLTEDKYFGTDTLKVVKLLGRDDVPESLFILLEKAVYKAIQEGRPTIN